MILILYYTILYCIYIILIYYYIIFVLYYICIILYYIILYYILSYKRSCTPTGGVSLPQPRWRAQTTARTHCCSGLKRPLRQRLGNRQNKCHQKRFPVDDFNVELCNPIWISLDFWARGARGSIRIDGARSGLQFGRINSSGDLQGVEIWQFY